ncbi:MAG: polymerase [Acidobacteriota bacterium]|jgi:DNA polymerase V|nr:polymerase [Acidobacteriota bacterium]
MRRHVFACVDCNNFYVSCERVFAPALARAPVVVLSNNDGCVISRSEEAKALGVLMGAPYFGVRALCEARGVFVFSSNYALYGDMSRRVMETLERFTPEIDLYSIDEAFLDLSQCSKRGLIGDDALTATGREIRSTVRRWTGIPVSVGIAPTKTLAKLGANIAKHSTKAEGVVNLLDARHVDYALGRTSVRDVWNIGARLAKRLRDAGINTALQLRDADERVLSRRLSVAVGRTILELRGVSCLPLVVCKPTRKSIICSRSFGRPVETLAELNEAVAFHVSRAAEKLRRDSLAAAVLVVFVSTGRYSDERYDNSAVLSLGVATNFTPELIRHARRGVERIYREGLRYKKAGVMLFGLSRANAAQGGLFDTVDRARAARLMQTLDRINARMGAETLRYAAAGLKREWRMLCERRSPCYTTSWDELLPVPSRRE